MYNVWYVIPWGLDIHASGAKECDDTETCEDAGGGCDSCLAHGDGAFGESVRMQLGLSVVGYDE